MTRQKVVWVCKECGHTQTKWSGHCHMCKEWNSFSEERSVDDTKKRFASQSMRKAEPVLIKDVSTEHFARYTTSYGEWNRITGGGIVKGSLNLLGGEPGIGKSTLLLQLAEDLGKQGLIILYVCGEESVEQTSLRAGRLGIRNDRLYLLSETAFSSIRIHVETLKPDVLIVDSVQIVYKDDIQSAPGSVTQVRDVAMECMHIAKGSGITVFLVGHVTKTGELAGPRVLEHIVDTVFEFEGDRRYGYRLVRSIKNRFGPTDEVAIFQMLEEGLQEILNPSLVFMEERVKEAPGSMMIPTLKGTRPLLVEVQALVSPSPFPTPSRRCTGADPKRLTLLLAVLEKQMGYRLHSFDVFVSVAGGMRLVEPAADLGILLAIASSHSGRAIVSDEVAVGEVGLAGEIRSVPRIESRLKESIHMGCTRCIMAKKHVGGLRKGLREKINVCGVDSVADAVNHVIGEARV
ncbi:MAG: DNA repair protein RadA [Simkaniaceae bacterium]|nr:DNA repair protein RadA [Simkaniaceae bacterium]